MIWLVGDRGMLGTELKNALERARIEAIGTDREVSMLDPAALKAFIEGKHIEWIVNCAAYTAVEKAEDEVDLCRSLNRDGPANLAQLASSIGAKLLHISTDYVFNGKGSKPYLESDSIDPIGVYGLTKAEGEAEIAANCRESVIVRTAWLYGKHGPNFVYTMLRLMRERESIGVVADQYGSPCFARDLAEAITLILRSAPLKYGVYHFTNEGSTNWHEFALAILDEARKAGIVTKDCVVNPLTTAQYPTKVRRPAYSVLSKEKIGLDYGIKPRKWRDGLRAFIDDLRNDEARLSAYTNAK